MTDYLKNYIKEYLALVDDEMYEELYSNCDKADRTDLTTFLLSCNIKPDDYMSELPEYYLYKSKISSYNIFEGITSIGKYAFSDCRELTSIVIPDKVAWIGDFAFSYCESLTNVTIGNSVTSIGCGVFYDCTRLESINIPKGVTTVDDSAFENCVGLKHINLPDGVDRISGRAFCGCRALTSITFPRSITSIDEAAFWSCSSLSNIYYKGTKEDWSSVVDGAQWWDDGANFTIHCTDGNIKWMN